MNIELSRFRVIKGKSEVVDKWMNFLNENMEEVLLTLGGERMYVETIFREKCYDGFYFIANYWDSCSYLYFYKGIFTGCSFDNFNCMFTSYYVFYN